MNMVSLLSLLVPCLILLISRITETFDDVNINVASMLPDFRGSEVHHVFSLKDIIFVFFLSAFISVVVTVGLLIVILDFYLLKLNIAAHNLIRKPAENAFANITVDRQDEVATVITKNTQSNFLFFLKSTHILIFILGILTVSVKIHPDADESFANITVDHQVEVTSVMGLNTQSSESDLKMRIAMPMHDEEFSRAMEKEIEFIIDYVRNPGQYPVSPDTRPNEIFNKLPQRAPENPETFDVVWKDFNEIIMKGLIHWQHPRFHAFFPCGRSYPDILAETLISSLGTVGITWAANPVVTELDGAMVNWLGRAFGIPETFLFTGSDTSKSEGGGWLADSASDAIFCAIMAARHLKIEEEMAKLGNIKEDLMHERRAEIMSKLVAYGSFEAHSSFEKACKMSVVRFKHIEVYEKDDWGMRRGEVEKEMEKDIQRGLIPFYLHVALGTTSTASSDHLEELAPLGEKHKVWIHVDAAYAGSAWVVEKYRNNKGIDKVDSININLHKFFLISASITPFWTRHQKKYKEFFHVQPAYLKKTGGNDLRDWGIQLTRRFKALKVFFLLRMYGLSGMQAYVERIITMTQYMETLLVRIPNIKKFGQTNYGIFCVQYIEHNMTKEEINEATSNLCEFINNSRQLYLTHSDVRGNDIIRVAVTLERSTRKDVEESVLIFAQLVEEFKKTNDESKHRRLDSAINCKPSGRRAARSSPMKLY